MPSGRDSFRRNRVAPQWTSIVTLAGVEGEVEEVKDTDGPPRARFACLSLLFLLCLFYFF